MEHTQYRRHPIRLAAALLAAAGVLQAQEKFFTICSTPSSPAGLILVSPNGDVTAHYFSSTLEQESSLCRFTNEGTVRWCKTYTIVEPRQKPVPLGTAMIRVSPERAVATQHIPKNGNTPVATIALFDAEGEPLWMHALTCPTTPLQLGRSLSFYPPGAQLAAEASNGTLFLLGEYGRTADSTWSSWSARPVVLQLTPSGMPVSMTGFDKPVVEGMAWEPEVLVPVRNGVAVLGTAGPASTGVYPDRALSLVRIDSLGRVTDARLLLFDSSTFALRTLEIGGVAWGAEGFALYGSMNGERTETGTQLLTREENADNEGFVAWFDTDGALRWARMIEDYVPCAATITPRGDIIFSRWLGDNLIRFDCHGAATLHQRVARTNDGTTVAPLGDVDVAPSGALDITALAARTDGSVVAAGSIYPRWQQVGKFDSLWPQAVQFALLHLDTQLRPQCALVLPDTVDVLPLQLRQRPITITGRPLPLPRSASLTLRVEQSVPEFVDVCTNDWPQR